MTAQPTLDSLMADARPAYSGIIFLIRMAACVLLANCVGQLGAEPPSAEYIFPAGGQRGTSVQVRVGAHYLHGGSPFEMDGPGVDASPHIEETETIWFEGPMLIKPASQAGETYPRDHAALVEIDSNATIGSRRWRLWTSQGVISSRLFVVGDLPEVLEEEVDGKPIPQAVKTPVTINGRIFPREDIDIWTFEAEEGQVITCAASAAAFGSPLDSVLELFDPSGRRVAFNDDHIGTDSRLSHQVTTDGQYHLHIYDRQYRGLQPFVYRLTVTTDGAIERVFPLGGQANSTTRFQLYHTGGESSVDQELPDVAGINPMLLPFRITESGRIENQRIDVSEHHQFYEAEAGQGVTKFPAAINGRITEAKADQFPLVVQQPGPYRLQLLAQSLGSPLDAKLTIRNSDGKSLASWGDPANPKEVDEVWNCPEAGTYQLEIASVWEDTYGPEYAYRLKINGADKPDFQLTVLSDSLTLDRGATAKLKVTAKRTGGLKSSIAIEFGDLPAGVTISNAVIAEGKNDTEVVFTAAADAKVQLCKLNVTGRATRDQDAQPDQKTGEETKPEQAVELSRLAAISATVPADIDPSGKFQLMIAMPTPFVVDGEEFQTRYAARGTVFRRHYVLQRNGYEGPLKVLLADRQVRHLQGVTGPTIQLTATQNAFDYPIRIPTWLEMNRTSRTVVMAVGEVLDEQGKSHTVAFTSGVPKDQIILLTAPSPLDLQVSTPVVELRRNSTTTVTVRLNRGQLPRHPAAIQLITPAHFGNITAEQVTIAGDQATANLEIMVGDTIGTLNMPATVRATMPDENGDLVVADVKLELVK